MQPFRSRIPRRTSNGGRLPFGFKLGGGLFAFFFIAIFALVIGSCIAAPFISQGTEDVVTITIEDKERVTDRNAEDSRYIVWTTVTKDDGSTTSETFEVTDDVFQGKWRASDTYGQLRIGETYRVKVNGIRFGPSSSYRNILEVQERISR